MVVGHLDLAVVRDIAHIDVRVGRTVGVDNILGIVGCIVFALCVSVLQEIVITATGVLRLIAIGGIFHLTPKGSRHCAVVRQSLQVLLIYVVRCDTVGLRNTGGEVVIGSEELNRGDLLEREVAPVLIQVEHRIVTGFACFERHGEVGLAVAVVTVVEQRLLVLVRKVLANLKRNGQQHVTLAQQHAVFKAGAVRVGHDVQVAVMLVTGNVKDQIVVLVPNLIVRGIEAGFGFHGELVSTADGVIARVCCQGRFFGVYLDVFGGEGISFLKGCLAECLEVMGEVGIDALTHVEIVFGAALRSKNGAVFGSGILYDSVLTILQSHLHAAAGGILEQNVAEDTRTLDVKSDVFSSCPIHTVKRGMLALCVLDDQLLYGICCDIGDLTDLGNAARIQHSADANYVVHFVGIYVQGSVEVQGRRVVGDDLVDLEILDLNRVAARTDKVKTKTVNGTVIGVVFDGQVVECEIIGVPLTVGVHGEPYPTGVRIFIRAKFHVKLNLGNVGGTHGQLKIVYLSCAELDATENVRVNRACNGGGQYTVSDNRRGGITELAEAFKSERLFVGELGFVGKALVCQMNVIVVIAKTIDVRCAGGRTFGRVVGISVIHLDVNVHGIGNIGLAAGRGQCGDLLELFGIEVVGQLHLLVFNGIRATGSVGVVSVYTVGEPVCVFNQSGIIAGEQGFMHGLLFRFGRCGGSFGSLRCSLCRILGVVLRLILACCQHSEQHGAKQKQRQNG